MSLDPNAEIPAVPAGPDAQTSGTGWGALAGQALDAVSSRIAIVDRDGTIVAVNRAWRTFAHVHGASDRQACEGANFYKVCAAPNDPEHDAAVEAAEGLQHVLSGTLPMFSGEEPCRLPNELLWSEIRIAPLRVADRMMAIVSYDDITARKRVELALRETEAAHDRAQKIAMVGSWSVDFAAQLFHTSPEGARLLGWDSATRPMSDLTAIIHPDDLEWESNEWRRAAAGNVPLDIEYRLVLGGETRWVRTKAEFTHGPDGQPTHAFGVTQDITERRAMLDDMARERAQLRTLLDTIPDAVWLKDVNGAYVACNPAFEELMQASEAQLRGRTDYDFATREQADGFRRDDQRAMAAGTSIRFEETFRTAVPGHDVIMETIKTPLHFGGRLMGVLGISRDITEQRRVSAALAESERLKQFALDAAEQGTWHQVAGTPMVHLDARARALWDVDDPTLSITELIESRVPAEDRSRIFGSAAMTSPGRHSMEFRVRHRNGAERWLLANVQVLHDDRGPAPGSLTSHGTVQDVTERRTNEETVTRFLSANPVVLYALGIVDGGFPIRWFSGNLQQMSGWSPDDVKTNPMWWVDNLHPDDRQRVIGVNATLLQGQPSSAEFRFRRPDGSYFWVRDEKRVLHDAQGRPSEVVGSWSDITQRVQLEERLRQSHKLEAIGLLAGGVAHDFNNLLTVIGGNSDLLRPLVSYSPHASQLLSEIREAGHRAGSLTRQLLAFSRSQVLAPKVVALNTLVTQVKTMLTRLIGEDIEFVCELGDDAGHVLVDAGQFEQVVVNLAVNARDAMPRGGRLTLATGCTTISADYTQLHPDVQSGCYAVLSVTDTGSGIPPELLERIFEPFFTTKSPGHGTGLGLSMAFGTVKQSGGHIDVQTRLGHGTTFTIYLPQVTPVEAPVPDGRAEVSPRHGHETVLLVEDEESVRKLARIALERSGYTVLSAENGLAALQVAEAYPDQIDLLVTDVVMPGMRGPDLAHALGSRRPPMKVLFISGYVQDALDRADVSEANFLLKPFSLRDLAAKVRDVLDAL